MAKVAPLALRLAVRALPADARDEMLRELLEQHREIASRRGWARAALWAWRQPGITWTWPAREGEHRMMSTLSNGLGQDIAASARSLARRPGLTIAVVATVAVTVGAIAAVAGVIDAVLLKPLPFPAPSELVWVGSYQQSAGDPPFDRDRVATRAYANPMDVVDWAQRSTRVAALAPFETAQGTMLLGRTPRRVNIALVGRAMSDVTRLAPVHGRMFVPSDFGSTHRTAVLSFNLWQSAFGGDPAAVGQTVTLDDGPLEVIGVLPDLGFRFPADDTDLWMPLPPLAPDFANRGGVWQRVVARLQPAASVADAQQDFDRVARDLEAAYPATNKDRRVAVVPLRDALVGSTASVLWLLGGGVALVLLIAAANVGHLLLVHAQSRRRELAVRAALGARPTRLARLLLAESTILALAGGAAGLIFGAVMLNGFVRLYPEHLPAVGQIHLGATACAAAAAGMLLAALLGVVPSLLQARGQALQQTIRSGERGLDDRGQRRLRAALVVTQVALSTTMLIGGGLLVRTFLNMRATDPGFAQESVLTFNLSLSERRYPDLADEVRFYGDLLASVRALPGVAAAGASTLLPLAPGEFGDGFRRVGYTDAPPNLPIARLQNVTPGYLEAVGVPLKAGRTLTSADGAGAAPVLVVNEAFQRRYFPGGAVGQHIRFRGVVAEIVGLVGDKHHQSLRDTPRPDMYFPRAQIAHPRLLSWVAVRGAGNMRDLVGPIRDAVTRLDPNVAVEDPQLMSERVGRALGPDRFRAALIGALALVALLLAAIGLYGLIAYAVARDTRTIAIRMALGASAGATVGGVVRSVLWLTGGGILAGIVAAWAAERWLDSFLVGVTGRDPLVIGTVVVTLAGVSILAAFGPARRASRVDPAAVLRSQ